MYIINQKNVLVKGKFLVEKNVDKNFGVCYTTIRKNYAHSLICENVPWCKA
jgi:hypothetical protein